MGWLIFAKGCAHQQSGQTKEETDHRPAAQGQKMGFMLYNQKAGGTRRQLVLCKGLDEGMKAGQRPPHQTCCAVQSSGALCTLQSQLGATEPPASALCCSHPQQPKIMSPPYTCAQAPQPSVPRGRGCLAPEGDVTIWLWGDQQEISVLGKIMLSSFGTMSSSSLLHF